SRIVEILREPIIERSLCYSRATRVISIITDHIALNLLLETSYLRSVGFGDPDFRKLLQHSQEGRARILIPHIVWEEWPTHLVKSTLTKAGKLRKAIEDLATPWMGGLCTDALVPSGVSVLADADIDLKSIESMAAFVAKNKIEIIPIGTDHAERAWTRYFN